MDSDIKWEYCEEGNLSGEKLDEKVAPAALGNVYEALITPVFFDSVTDAAADKLKAVGDVSLVVATFARLSFPLCPKHSRVWLADHHCCRVSDRDAIILN